MKTVPTLLACSLALNAALLAAVIVKPQMLHLSRTGPSAGNLAGAAPSDPGTERPSGHTGEPEVWTQLSGASLSDLRDRLRAAGFPPAVVKAVLQTLLSEQYAAKRSALLSSMAPRPYWKKDGWGFVDAKTQVALTALQKEQTETMKGLLGADSYTRDPMTGFIIQRIYGNLGPAKIDQIARIQSDYRELMNEVYASTSTASSGIFLSEDQDKINYLRQQQQADIEHSLSPQEYEDYELHSSTTAQVLQGRLYAFNPSESEYRAIFELQSAFDKQYNNPSSPMTPDQAASRAAADKELQAQIATALGPQRYSDYQQQTDPSYIQTSQLVDRLGLPEATTAQVVSVQKAIQAQACAVQSDLTLGPGEKAAQLSALADQASSQLAPLLGELGMKAYATNGGGWLASLRSPTK